MTQAQRTGAVTPYPAPPPIGTEPVPVKASSTGPDANDRSIVTILTGLWEKTETLVRQEMKLASAELDEKMAKAKRELVALGTAGGLLFAGFVSLVAALILLLSEVMEPWLAAAIVGVVATGAGLLLVQRERRAAAELVPDRTIDSVKKDAKAIREATHDSI